MTQLPRPGRVLGQWARHAQQQACRNAMVASTTLADRRAQRLEVEEFLASLDQRHEDVRTATRPTG